MKFLHLVARNLLRKKVRTLLTVLSIGVAFILYGLLATLRQSLDGGVAIAGADRLVVRQKISLIQPLPENYRQKMERIPGVSAAVHMTWFNGIYQDPKNQFPNSPVDPEGYLAMFPEYTITPEEKKAWLAERTGMIVGRTTADRFGWKRGDRIALQSPIWPKAGTPETWEFVIVGIFETTKQGGDTSWGLFRHDYFEEARARGKGLVGWYYVRVADPAKAADVARAIDLEFENSAYETKTEPEGAFAAGFAQQIGDITTIVLGIMGAVFFTILLIAGNTMAQSVRERTEELGVLKALGFTNERVLGIVLGESCLIAAIGGGAGLGLIALIVSRGSPMPSMLPVFFLPARDALIGVGLILLVGLVAGILPAIQAMRLPIAVALRRGT